MPASVPVFIGSSDCLDVAMVAFIVKVTSVCCFHFVDIFDEAVHVFVAIFMLFFGDDVLVVSPELEEMCL